jgi:predicted membrane channel-forming protein YqfA (hemolysin III family)
MQLFTKKVLLLVSLALIACVVMLFVKPIPQDQRYHHFADERMYFSIPNFWNVISNVPYFIFGGAGILFLIRERKNNLFRNNYWAYQVFFIGAFLISFGSAYYHAWPDNETLVWDRLPMTVAFMGFFAVIVGEYINAKAGRILLFPLVALGVLSVLYWIFTEHEGRGDLRWYAIVQYLPMILLPLIVILFRTSQSTKYLWYMMLAYLLAKIFEAGDFVLFEKTPLSGHTLKHFAASCAPLFFWLYFRNKKKSIN